MTGIRITASGHYYRKEIDEWTWADFEETGRLPELDILSGARLPLRAPEGDPCPVDLVPVVSAAAGGRTNVVGYYLPFRLLPDHEFVID